MTDKSGVAEQVLPLPKGGGDVKGLGEKFSPDPYTGTGAYSVPLTVPPGRRGLAPALGLTYDTGAGNGPFGLGWSLALPAVTRQTDKGLPRYDDGQDTFVISGAEDLTPIGGNEYRPRADTAFAQVQHIQTQDDDYWLVRLKDGSRQVYGRSPDAQVYHDAAGQRRIFAWLLEEMTDVFGNQIIYQYKPDRAPDPPHEVNQTCLKAIYYLEYGADADGPQGQRWLCRVLLDYGEGDREGWDLAPDLVDPALPPAFRAIEQAAAPASTLRPDPFSAYRAGFEVRTQRRCWRISVQIRPEGIAAYQTVRAYYLSYTQAPYSNLSLLSQVQCIGFRPDEPARAPEALPPLTLEYTAWDPTRRTYENLTAPNGWLPDRSLSDASYELVDLFGNGLPDVLHTTSTGYRYWRNLGGLRFAPPVSMDAWPNGVTLADPGVQLADMEGNGSADLLVTQGATTGYYPNRFDGRWAAFHAYGEAPSFDLKDPNVQLVDLDGDGVVDVLATLENALVCFTNRGRAGWERPQVIPRQHDLAEFPDVFFDSDGRVQLGDMTGDGLQDIVVVHSGYVAYWPNLGHGRFGRRVTMRCPPVLERSFDPQRLFLTDINGDGHADLVYVGFDRVHCWINQSGNSWSEGFAIHGTPPTQADSVRVADVRGTGTAGVLWTYDPSPAMRSNYKYLDFTGGVKPHLLNRVDSGTGAITTVAYAPSTEEYVRDAQEGRPWRTTLPFPVQVVSRVQVIDVLSRGKLTTEYRYHHGYWDGIEREFRGFGRVDQRDTEAFERYHAPQPDASLVAVSPEMFSPPLEKRTWFHQGPVGDELCVWTELDLSDEFWTEDPNVLSRPAEMTHLLGQLPLRARRDALRALRGRSLRTELFARDGAALQERPYTVTEQLHGVYPVAYQNGQAWLIRQAAALPGGWAADGAHPPVFFPHALAQRTTQWERGDDPLIQVIFTGDYDDFGQPRCQTSAALPRRRARRRPITGAVVGQLSGDQVNETRILTTHVRTAYAAPDPGLYIHDRIAQMHTFEFVNPPTVVESAPDDLAQVLQDHAAAAQGVHREFETRLAAWSAGEALPAGVSLLGHTLHHYDGQSFVGRPAGQVGPYGALTRSESLVFTDRELDAAYGDQRPAYLGGQATLPPGAPDDFERDPGYRLEQAQPGSYQRGYYADAQRFKFDFQDNTLASARGNIVALEDALGHRAVIELDNPYQLFPRRVVDAAGLETVAGHDYFAMQLRQVTDPNGNATHFRYTALGLLHKQFLQGRNGEGGSEDEPETEFTYDLHAYARTRDGDNPQPIFVHKIRRLYHAYQNVSDEIVESREYTDGFGRLLQARAQAAEVLFGPTGDDVGLPSGLAIGQQVADGVIVSGWRVYDNKSRVVEQYEPFFAAGWTYQPQAEAQRGQHLTFYYDPRGQAIRKINPDGATQRIIQGAPRDLTDPQAFDPTPWEACTYDVNDNAGRTHGAGDPTHWNTPLSIVIDALGRTIVTVERNGADPAADWRVTRSTYDVKGNVLAVTDALGRLAFGYTYDLSDRPLRSQSIDAGERLTVLDALGNRIEWRDSKGALALQRFDSLNRPCRLWARDAADEPLTLREHIVYGDSPDSGLSAAQAQAANLLGRLYRHYDEAGLLTYKACDFKGNPLEKVRQVIGDRAILAVFPAPDDLSPDWQIKAFRVDWQPPAGTTLADHAAGLLDATGFCTSMAYDALNRATRVRYPQGAAGERQVLHLRYNRAGALERVELGGALYVAHMAYNAKGQRTLIAYGNGLMTRYAYHPQTFRLAQLRTERYTAPAPLTYRPSGSLLQDLTCTYDLAGNLTAIQDRAPGSGIPNTPLGQDALDRVFTYDPLYHLLSANGRECDGPPDLLPWDDRPRDADVTRSRAYSEQYQYDAAGNVTRLRHQADGHSFTRIMGLAADSNRLASVTIGDAVYGYAYDAGGNMLRETTSRHFEWDYRDLVKVYRTQAGSAEPSVHVHYLYNAGGQRMKKLVRKQGGQVETTVYIDQVFEQHTWSQDGVVRRNNHLHVMDNQNRVALVRVGDPHPKDTAPAVQYHLADHLGSSNLVVDGAGTWLNREEFTPYGETGFGSFARKRYRFTGKERDEESGLSYHDARYYAPWLGKWLSPDPLGMVDGTNLYQYSRANPQKYTDPKGTNGDDDDSGLMGTLGAIWGGAKEAASEAASGAYESASSIVTNIDWEDAAITMAFGGPTSLPYLIWRGTQIAEGEADVNKIASDLSPAYRIGQETVETYVALYDTAEAVYEGDWHRAGQEYTEYIIRGLILAADILSVAYMLKAPRTTIQGHGRLVAGDTTKPPLTIAEQAKVPEGTSVHLYGESGGTISGLDAELIQLGIDPPWLSKQILKPGEKLPALEISSLDPRWWKFDTTLTAKISGKTITVDKPTMLQDILKPDMGNIYVSTCQYSPGGKLKPKW
jgi:RHS repeat-associated protein